MGINYSEEQQAVLGAGTGFNMVVANAGVGKTEISAEFIVLNYLKEELILFPEAATKGHVSGEAQLKILKQFKVISFTVKAAGELNERVYRKFRERGIPVPQAFGKDFILSRTCDSFLQRWLTHPMVMSVWYSWDTRWSKRMTEMVGMLSTSGRKRVDEEAAKLRGEFRQERAFQRLWGPLIDDSVKNALMLAVTPKQALFAPGYDLAKQMATLVSKYLGGINGEVKGSWSQGLYQQIAHKGVSFRAPFDEKVKHLEDPALGLEEHSRKEAELRPWLKTAGLATECAGVYDLSRSVGYHPEHAQMNMLTKVILDKLATHEFLNSFSLFHAVATEFEKMKLLIGAMDFGDFLQFTKSTFEKNPYLLEKKKEYPSYGLRSKYVIWDEAQDNSLWQYWLLNLLCGTQGSNFHCLVLGDPKQAIYSFRGGNADEFVRNIRFLKEHATQHLYSLTTSFRSCKKIVGIGNEVARALPAGKVEALDSKAVYVEEGEIVVSPPLRDQNEETKYIQEQYKSIRSKHGDKSSIMLLVRSGIELHPVTKWVNNQKDPNLCILTQHRSKGLEADHVFLLGCTAGKYPDPRSSIEDEINLFYVACTRPRMVLYICCPIVLTSANGDEKATGPSPFIFETPSLQKIALSGNQWTKEMLQAGVKAHKGLVAMFVSKCKERQLALVEEAKNIAPDIPEMTLTRKKAMDTGARWKKQYRDPNKMHIKPKAFNDFSPGNSGTEVKA